MDPRGFERILGQKNNESAVVYNNLGALYYSSGFFAQAREMHEQALEIREHCTNINSADLGQSYANLATTLLSD